MFLIFYIVLLFLGLFLLQEIFRRFQRFTLVFFLVLPFFLIPYWKIINVGGWFVWIKMFLVSFGVLWFSVFRLAIFGENKFAKVVVYLILIANILEAVVVDFISVGMAHNLNVIAGILLLLTLDKNINSFSFFCFPTLRF